MRPVVPKVKALACPNCGSAVELRSHGNATCAVCPSCLTVLDARNESLAIVQKFKGKQRFEPLIPLGSKGTLDGAVREVIGFQVRQIQADGAAYRWAEYLLYNPFQGYLYLSEYDGHWNVIRTLRSLPVISSLGARRVAISDGRNYRHFQSARAKTIFVLGEFPWQVRTTDELNVDDYIDPPLMLSSEADNGEVTWSRGVYTPARKIATAFELESLPKPRGIFANQPSKYKGTVFSAWKTAAVLWVALISLAILLSIATHGPEVFSQNYTFTTANKGEASFVTPVFTVPRKSTLEVSIDTNLNNDWAYFSLALINDEDGTAWDFGKEVSYYSGRDSDGNWTEGERKARSIVPGVPPGRYYLRVEPEMNDEAAPHSVSYGIAVRAGTMDGLWLVVAFFLIPLPAIWLTWRSVSFETRRWAESDYASS